MICISFLFIFYAIYVYLIFVQGYDSGLVWEFPSLPKTPNMFCWDAEGRAAEDFLEEEGIIITLSSKQVKQN